MKKRSPYGNQNRNGEEGNRSFRIRLKLSGVGDQDPRGGSEF